MKIEKTTEGLRNVLFEELEGFLSGKYDTQHVNTVTRSVNSILATVAKDLEAVKLAHEMNQGKDQPKSVADLHLNIMLTNQLKKTNENKN